MASELATRFPACGGCVEWASVLGKPAALANAYVRVIGSLFDNSLYPVMVADYLSAVLVGLDHWYWRLSITLVVVPFVVFCNLAGLEAVGWVSVGLSVIILLPFIIFTSLSVGHMTAARIFAGYPAGQRPNYSLLVSTMVWQFGGFDTVAALSDEVQNPRRTFPVAMFLTIILITVLYVLPTIAAISIEPDVKMWDSGSFATNARKLPYCSSGWLGSWISLAGAASSLLLLNAALSCNGRELYAAGKLGALPFAGFLGAMGVDFTGSPCPVRAIVVEAALTVPFSLFNFDRLVEWSSLLFVIAQFFQIAVFITFRANCRRADKAIADERGLDDRFVIPGGWFGATLCVVPTGIIACLLCALEGWQALGMSIVIVAAFVLLKIIDLGVQGIISRQMSIVPASAVQVPMKKVIR
jgi:amino acid transporter